MPLRQRLMRRDRPDDYAANEKQIKKPRASEFRSGHFNKPPIYLVVSAGAGYLLAGELVFPPIGLFISGCFCMAPPMLPESFTGDPELPAESLLLGPPPPPAAPVVCANDGAAAANDRAKPSVTIPNSFFIWNSLFEESLLALTIAHLKEFLQESRSRACVK
jgi:hypothetical protein